VTEGGARACFSAFDLEAALGVDAEVVSGSFLIGAFGFDGDFGATFGITMALALGWLLALTADSAGDFEAALAGLGFAEGLFVNEAGAFDIAETDFFFIDEQPRLLFLTRPMRGLRRADRRTLKHKVINEGVARAPDQL
jgi:hypothetical protein